LHKRTPPATASWPDLAPELAVDLQRGCEALGLDIAAERRELMLRYLALLAHWNRVFNLTAVRDERQMVTRHLLDSLAVAPHVCGERLLDAGSGAGLPGIPLAILFPGREFFLLDSSGKKTRFLFQVKTALGLDNMSVQRARAETFVAGKPFDAVLSRAFAPLGDMLAACRHLLAPGGCFLAMKGAYPGDELQALADRSLTAAVHPLRVPGLDEQRHLVVLRTPGDAP